MKINSLEVRHKDFFYYFEPITGALLKRSGASSTKKKLELIEKVSNALILNDEPYKLNMPDLNSVSNSYNIKNFKKYAVNLTYATLKSFALGKLYTSFKQPYFENATEAITFYRSCSLIKNQSDLCLPRTLFAASLSKRFKQNGVIFIGVSLPSKSMHAWIIEDGVQPDPFDTMWVNFQPVAILY